MKRLICTMLSAMLLLTGCGAQTDTAAEEPLTEDQIALMETIGMGDDPAQLTAKEKSELRRIDAMMQYLNEKYKEPFIFNTYVPRAIMQSEKLYAAPVSNPSVTVTVKPDYDGFTDDYNPPKKPEGPFGSGPITYYLEDTMREQLADMLKTEYGLDTMLFFIDHTYPFQNCITDMAEVIENEDGGQDFQWLYSCHSTLWIPENTVKKMELRELAVKAADWINERHIMWQFAIRTLKEGTDFSQLDRGNIQDAVQVAPYEHDWLYEVDIEKKKIHEYEGDSALSLDYEHAEYLSGKNKWFPVYVQDVKYHGNTVIEQMRWQTFTEDSYSYWVTAEAKPGHRSFPKIGKILEAAGWSFYTNNKDSFSWRKGDRTVRFLIVDDEEALAMTETDRQWLGLSGKKMICKVNGEETKVKLLNYDLVGHERIPEYRNGEILVQLSVSVEAYKELFGIVIEIDRSGTDYDHPFAKAKVTAIDCYD